MDRLTLEEKREIIEALENAGRDDLAMIMWAKAFSNHEEAMSVKFGLIPPKSTKDCLWPENLV